MLRHNWNEASAPPTFLICLRHRADHLRYCTWLFRKHVLPRFCLTVCSSSGDIPKSPPLPRQLPFVAATAIVNRQFAKKAQRDNPPQGRFIDVDGVRLNYVERGNGRPLVLFHGNGSMIQDFQSSGLIDLAAENYKVIVFDRQGFGKPGEVSHPFDVFCCIRIQRFS